MSGSLTCSNLRGQFVGTDADVLSQNPIVILSTAPDKRVQTKVLKARHLSRQMPFCASAWA